MLKSKNLSKNINLYHFVILHLFLYIYIYLYNTFIFPLKNSHFCYTIKRLVVPWFDVTLFKLGRCVTGMGSLQQLLKYVYEKLSEA